MIILAKMQTDWFALYETLGSIVECIWLARPRKLHIFNIPCWCSCWRPSEMDSTKISRQFKTVKTRLQFLCSWYEGITDFAVYFIELLKNNQLNWLEVTFLDVRTKKTDYCNSCIQWQQFLRLLATCLVFLFFINSGNALNRCSYVVNWKCAVLTHPM